MSCEKDIHESGAAEVIDRGERSENNDTVIEMERLERLKRLNEAPETAIEIPGIPEISEIAENYEDPIKPEHIERLETLIISIGYTNDGNYLSILNSIEKMQKQLAFVVMILACYLLLVGILPTIVDSHMMSEFMSILFAEDQILMDIKYKLKALEFEMRDVSVGQVNLELAEQNRLIYDSNYQL